MRKLLFPAFFLLAGLTIAAERPASKVVGGEDASRSYPWMAGLHIFDPVASTYGPEPFCGGSLIAPGWVVSAAHCFTSAGNGGNPGSYSPQADELIIRLDSPDLNDLPDRFAQYIVAHPQYGVADGSDDSDIMLIQLTSKAALSTVSLADNDIMMRLEDSTVLDEVVQIIGWGVYDGEDFAIDGDGTATGSQPDYLQSANLDYLPFSDGRCNSAWGGLTTNMICAWEPQPDAGDTFGEDACFGDSGGPLLIPANTTLSSGIIEDDWLLGATSFGSTACNSSDTPGVYTKLANFDLWIEQTTASRADALIDIRADLTVPAMARPDQDFNVEVLVMNGSLENSANTPVMVLTSEALSLSPVDGFGCVAITQGWSCSLSSLAAGQQHNRSFTASWSGADEGTASVSLEVAADQDDYRIANNLRATDTTITLLPDPVLDPFSVLSNRNRVASVTITARNASEVNDANGVEVVFEVPAGLTVTDDNSCTLVSPSQLSCSLGNLAAGASQQIGLQLEGSGTFAITASLQNINGDVITGDTEQTLNITLKKKSSGGAGSPMLWILGAVSLYLRRKLRNQSSS
jgi:secreted trypsin-like serine protease